jgi:hypothetical protein
MPQPKEKAVHGDSIGVNLVLVPLWQSGPCRARPVAVAAEKHRGFSMTTCDVEAGLSRRPTAAPSRRPNEACR